MPASFKHITQADTWPETYMVLLARDLWSFTLFSTPSQLGISVLCPVLSL